MNAVLMCTTGVFVFTKKLSDRLYYNIMFKLGVARCKHMCTHGKNITHELGPPSISNPGEVTGPNSRLYGITWEDDGIVIM